MASSGIFQFGIEIELLVESPNRKHTKWKDLANDISATLAKEAGITAEVDTAGDYTQWSIVNEVTVQNPGKPCQIPLSMISFSINYHLLNLLSLQTTTASNSSPPSTPPPLSPPSARLSPTCSITSQF